MYKCTLCQEGFTSKHGLAYHIEKKVCHRPNVTCDNCGKIFKTKRNCQYHISQGVCLKKKPALKLKPSYDNMTRNDLIAEINQLKGKYESLKENPQNITNNVTNNVVIFPTEFGNENIGLITEKCGDILGPLIKNHPFRSIPTLFTKIHNNDELPEYHNVYLASERSSYAMISDGKSFTHKPKKTIIDRIIEEKRSLLNKYADQNGEQLGEKVLKKYENYQNRIDDDTEFRKELELEIGGLLLDMKSVIANDDKTRELLERVNEGQFELPADIQP